MDTAFGRSSTMESIKQKVGRFYDIASPYYLQMLGPHIHDGYYVTGRESAEEAQVNLIRRLAERAGIGEATTVLDIGCGVGGSSIWLAEHLKAITTGITISPVQVEIARKTAQERGVTSSFQLMDAEELHFSGTFDVIWMVAVLTHAKEQANIMKSATELLNKGGNFVLYDWMLGEGIYGDQDAQIDAISQGMLLASLEPMNFYLDWFTGHGYRIVHSEDMTARTVKTWDVALAAVVSPSVWRLAYRATGEERRVMMTFSKSLKPMKLAMQSGKLKSGAIIAERI